MATRGCHDRVLERSGPNDLRAQVDIHHLYAACCAKWDGSVHLKGRLAFTRLRCQRERTAGFG